MAKKYKISGKRSGPPPLRGPNPNVPPIKMKYGGGADMGDPGRAEERASRGYGSVGPAQDKGSPEQNANQRAQVRAGNVRAAEKLIDRPSPLDTAFKGAKLLGNIATFGVSKALDIPLGAMRVAKNIVGPLTNNLSTGLSKAKTKADSMLSNAKPLAGVLIEGLQKQHKASKQNLMDYEGAAAGVTKQRTNAMAMREMRPDNGIGLCPDGSMPPCPVVTAKNGKSIKVRGTKAAIRGTGFKGVF